MAAVSASNIFSERRETMADKTPYDAIAVAVTAFGAAIIFRVSSEYLSSIFRVSFEYLSSLGSLAVPGRQCTTPKL